MFHFFFFCPKVKKLIPYLQVSHRKVKRIGHLAVGSNHSSGLSRWKRSTHPSSTKWSYSLFSSLAGDTKFFNPHAVLLVVDIDATVCRGIFLLIGIVNGSRKLNLNIKKFITKLVCLNFFHWSHFNLCYVIYKKNICGNSRAIYGNSR